MLPELFFPSADVGLYRPHRIAQGICYFLMRHPRLETEGDACAFGLAQMAHRARNILRRCIWSRNPGLIHLRHLFQFFHAPVAFAFFGCEGPVRDREEPRMKPTLAPIGSDALVGAKKSLLGDIVGKCSISTAQPQQKRANGTLVFSHQRRKCVAVVVSNDPRDEWSVLHPPLRFSLRVANTARRSGRRHR